EKAGVDERMKSVDGMIAIERTVSSRLQMNERQTTRLLSDLENALRMASESPRGRSITNLQERVRAIRDETCAESEWLEAQLRLPIPQRPKRWGLGRVVRIVVKVIVILGG